MSIIQVDLPLLNSSSEAGSASVNNTRIRNNQNDIPPPLPSRPRNHRALNRSISPLVTSSSQHESTPSKAKSPLMMLPLMRSASSPVSSETRTSSPVVPTGSTPSPGHQGNNISWYHEVTVGQAQTSARNLVGELKRCLDEKRYPIPTDQSFTGPVVKSILTLFSITFKDSLREEFMEQIFKSKSPEILSEEIFSILNFHESNSNCPIDHLDAPCANGVISRNGGCQQQSASASSTLNTRRSKHQLSRVNHRVFVSCYDYLMSLIFSLTTVNQFS